MTGSVLKLSFPFTVDPQNVIGCLIRLAFFWIICNSNSALHILHICLSPTSHIGMWFLYVYFWDISYMSSTSFFPMITWARFHTLTFTRKYSTFFLLSYDWKHLYCSSKRNFHFGSLRNSLCKRSYDNLFDLRLKTQLFPRSNPPDGGLTPDQI